MVKPLRDTKCHYHDHDHDHDDDDDDDDDDGAIPFATSVPFAFRQCVGSAAGVVGQLFIQNEQTDTLRRNTPFIVTSHLPKKM